jgi:hypothetical protein
MFNLRKKATALSSTNTERFYKSKACSRAILISFILILTLGPAFTQIYAGHAASSKPKPPPPPPSNSTNWAKAYAFQYDYSSAYSVRQLSNGGYIAGGLCDSGTAPATCNGHATVIRVDSSGNLQAQSQYSYPGHPEATALSLIRPTSDGGAIFAGQPQFGCPETGLTGCAAIVKLDSNANVQWAKDLQYSVTAPYSSPTTYPADLEQTSGGGYVVAGYAIAPASYNPWIAKLSSTGQLQWQHVFADPNSQYSAAYAVRQTLDGGYVLSGEIYSGQIFVLRLDSTGAPVWQHTYSAGTDTYENSLELTSDGGFILGGSVYTAGSSGVILLKLDSTGNAQWARRYVPSGSISDLQLTMAQQTRDGGYAFSGYYFQNTVYDERAWLVKTDSVGNVQWDKIYGADVQYANRKFLSFQQTSDGGFIAAGFTNQYNNGYTSLWLVKTDSNGNISGCSDIKNSPDATNSLAVTVSNADLKANGDGYAYLADVLSTFPGPLTATKEC